MEESTLSRSNPAYVMKGIHFLLGNPAYVIKGIHFLLANPKEIHHRGLILLFKVVDISSSSETQGQSVGSGEKAGRKFSSTGERAPGYRLSPNYFKKFKRMPAPDWAQKMLCIIVPNRRTVSPEFFSWVRTRRLLSRHTCPVRSPSLCVQGKLLFSTFLTRSEGTFGMLSAGAI